MGDVKSLRSGETFTVIQKKVKTPMPDNMTIGQTAAFNRQTQQEQAQIAGIKANFQKANSENGKVELLVEDADGVAVIQSKQVIDGEGNRVHAISLNELTQQGKALAAYALELKKFDENGDHFIEEHELLTSWGEQLTSAGVAVGISTAGGAGTGATIGGLGGTAVVPGIGTVAGAGALGLLGGAIGFIGSAIWEGGKTVVYAAGDKYNSAGWAR